MKVECLLLVASYSTSLATRPHSTDIKEHFYVSGNGEAKLVEPITSRQTRSLLDSEKTKNNVPVSGDTETNKVAASFLQGDDAAPTIPVENRMAEPNVNSTTSVEFLTIQRKLDVQSSAFFDGEVIFYGKIIHFGEVNFTSDVSTMRLHAQRIEVVEALEVGGAVFAKRLYTQDLSATGFISASSITSKGDMNVTGSIGAFEVTADKISSKQIDVSDEFRCSTAYVAGTLDAGSLSARKVTVRELIVNEENLIEVIKLLEHRIVALEKQLGKIEAHASSN